MATIVTGEQSIRIGNKLAEIQRQLYLQRGGYPYDPDALDAFLQRAVEGKFSDRSVGLLPKRVRISSQDAEFWQKYYHENHNIKADFSELEVPAPVDYPTRLIVMHKEISTKCNRVAAVYEKRVRSKGFNWWQFTTDMDASMKSHSRSGTYAIRVRDVREAEFGLVDGRNLSTQDVWDRGIATTTLPERLIDGDVRLLTKEEHLDQEKITLCADSKSAGGGVPGVGCSSGGRRVYVGGWCPDGADDSLRFRPAILA